MTSFGCGPSYNDVDTWVTQEYGNNGLNSDQFIEACDHYLDGYSSSISNDYGYSPGNQKIIVVITNAGKPSHAGVLEFYMGGALAYRDKDGQHILMASQTFACYVSSGCE